MNVRQPGFKKVIRVVLQARGEILNAWVDEGKDLLATDMETLVEAIYSFLSKPKSAKVDQLPPEPPTDA